MFSRKVSWDGGQKALEGFRHRQALLAAEPNVWEEKMSVIRCAPAAQAKHIVQLAFL